MAFALWDWKLNPTLTGKLTAKLNNIPPYGKKMYGFELDNGEIRYTFGTYVLVGFLAPLPFLTKVKLTFLGKGYEKKKDKFQKNLYDCVVLELPPRSKKAEILAARRAKVRLPRNNIKTSPKAK